LAFEILLGSAVKSFQPPSKNWWGAERADTHLFLGIYEDPASRTTE
jgi:hypothetical protein